MSGMTFTDRIYLGSIPALYEGIHPPKTPAGPSTTAAVRENRWQYTRAGTLITVRLAKLELVADFALPGQSCYACGLYSSNNPAEVDLSPVTQVDARWIRRDPVLLTENGAGGSGNVLELTPNGGQYVTARIVSGDLPTRFHIFGRLHLEGGTLPLG